MVATHSKPGRTKIENVHKTFSFQSPRPSLLKIVKEVLSGKEVSSEEFCALKDINIEIKRGDKVGVVGNNGAGKTTLMRLIAGLYRPNRGQVTINGGVTLLAGFGIGMLDELTVQENIFLYGAIYGMDREKTKENLYEIIEWAELVDFTHAQLKTLSGGMRARLAFSVTRHFDADILLFDEALSAGDRTFREKCQRVFENYKNDEKTCMFSSHATDFVEKLCAKTLWLHKGEQMAFGDTKTVLQQYDEFNTR